ncbi:hypothetical protein Tco_0173791 [Tanacetum coccineum]
MTFVLPVLTILLSLPVGTTLPAGTVYSTSRNYIPTSRNYTITKFLTEIDLELRRAAQQHICGHAGSDTPLSGIGFADDVKDDGSVDVNPFGGRKPRYANCLYQPRRNDHVVDHDDRYRDDPIRSLGLKIEIPELRGKVYPDDFIDWLNTVERVSDV